uniref:RNA helicase n=1 Tax=Pinguiococcus pyrenoidosus TaxID=172671 RepID=A0A7R9U272_9STRA|mmetsp:Transcript_11662/g.43460  ORF Transcript_11662/g.43460 Transcript_11662/m.43460 type:complete len:1080 (+) Transcript_11662:316-3555(+)
MNDRNNKRPPPANGVMEMEPKKRFRGPVSQEELERRRERARRFQEAQRLKKQQQSASNAGNSNRQAGAHRLRLSRRRRNRGVSRAGDKALSAFSGEDGSSSGRRKKRLRLSSADLGVEESKQSVPVGQDDEDEVDTLDAFMADLRQNDDLRMQQISDAALSWDYATQNPVAAAASASTGDAQGASMPAPASTAAAKSALMSASVLPSKAAPAAELSAQQADDVAPPLTSPTDRSAAPPEVELDKEDAMYEQDRKEFVLAQQRRMQEAQQPAARAQPAPGAAAPGGNADAAAGRGQAPGASQSGADIKEEDAEEATPGASAEGGSKRVKVELGRLFESEGDVMDEEERKRQEEEAIASIEAEAKKKEVKPVNHDEIDYIPFRKNLYIVPRALARLTQKEVQGKRDKMGIKVRGRACPPPVDKWSQCGLSDRLESLLLKHSWKEPFNIQKQAVPAIMSGRDVIGVAKTGSGKTLAFLLPMFRHILDQVATYPLDEGEGPIGLIMAPARELAVQIASEARKFARSFNLRVAAVYGGAGVKEQIAQLKRGAEVVVCTPGRMIDILTMQAGRLVSFQRVSFVVMDEADRMFDMGFEPQIRMILGQVRPDRQTLLFSATFPKAVERLARQVLKFPLEITVGGKSVASDNIRQIVEVHEDRDKFMRLLQLLGVWFERGSIIVFVQSQDKCDKLFQELVSKGYPCAAIHAAMDQADRDSTLAEFKKGENTLLIATAGVAGRGLDVPSVVMVVNYSCPNHLEDYVHRVGRTGRAGRKGTAYTFISGGEEQHSPTLIKALEQANQEIPPELKAMADRFEAKVAAGQAKKAASGFRGKGFTFDGSEKTEAQRLEDMKRKKTEIELGLRDATEDVDKARLEARLAAEATDRDEIILPSATLTGKQRVVRNADGAGGASRPPAAAAALVQALQASVAPPGTKASVAEAIRRVKAQAVGTKAGAGAATSARMQALAFAQQLNSQYTTQGAGGEREHNTLEVEINDFTVQARQKALSREFTAHIHEMFDVAIVVRGIYVPPGKPVPDGQRPLYIVIESPDRFHAEAARKEILRTLAEETMRSGPSSSAGRYSVL